MLWGSWLDENGGQMEKRGRRAGAKKVAVGRRGMWLEP